MHVALLGSGEVALHLAKGLSRAGHAITFGSRNPATVQRRMKDGVPTAKVVSYAEAAKTGDVVVFAVPFQALDETLKLLDANDLEGKPVVDATNALTPSYELALGHTTSGAEELQKKLPAAKVVKAFNTVFAANMVTGKLGDQKLSAFVAGDDEKAKAMILKLAGEIGFDPVDAGPLKNARYLEPMAMELIALAYGHGKMGPGIGFILARA